jgi:hypothetical protein
MTQTVAQPQTHRSSLRRWTLRFLVAALTLIIVIVVVTQIVLGTAIPRQIVVAQVQRILGLHITAKEVSTGWFGHTTLRDVTVSLPLAEHAFLEMPELRVDHTILPILLITQSIDIKSIALDHPKVYVTQDRDGRWNLEDVAQTLSRLGSSGPSPSGQPNSPLVLPKIDLRDGEIDITDNASRHATIAPLVVVGKPANALVWNYDVSCKTESGAQITLIGRVAPNDNFSHEVAFSLSHLDSLAKPWVANFDPNAAVEGNWRGAQTADGIAGRLQLRSVKYGEASTEGTIDISASGARAAATIASLTFRAGGSSFKSFKVTSGALSIDSNNATCNGLQISGLDGRALVNGSFAFADQSGDLHADWNALQPVPTVSSSGSIDTKLRSNWPDQRVVNVEIRTNGSAAANTYKSVIALNGSGKSWDAANWTLTAPTLQWSGKQSVVLDHLIAHFATTPGQLTLADINLPGTNTLVGGGGLTFDHKKFFDPNYNWWLYLQGQNWAIPNLPPASLAFGVNAWGDQAQIRLEQVFGIVGRIFAGVDGYYRFTKPKPVDLDLSICELPAPVGNAPDIIQGKVRGEGVLSGTAFPLSLDASGQLHGEQIVFDNRPPQRIDVKCTAALHHDLFAFDTEELSLFGGQWSMHGQIPARDKKHGDAPDITVRVHDLPLANIGDLVDQPGIAGLAAGSLEVDIDEPALNQITGSGHFQAKDVRVRQFKADSAAGDVSLHDGLLEVSPIKLQLNAGHATAKLSTKLSNPLLLTASLDASDWPVSAGPVTAVVSAKTENLSIDAGAQSANGQLHFGASATLQGRPLLAGDGSVGVSGRVINLQKLNAKILDGSASGSATVDIDHPLDARGTLRWDALNLSELAGYNNIYQSAAGFLTGRADLSPTNDSRALGPLMLDIASVGQAGRFRSVQFTELHLPIFFDTDRAVLSGGKIDVAGGSIGLFGRASLHIQDAVSTLVEAKLDDLDLEQLFHAADKSEADKIKSYPGRLSGTVSIVGDPRDKLQLFGQASLQIHDSDLGNFGPFAALYNTMHLGGNAGKAIGEGTVEARFDNDSLIVSSLRYFNRGVDAYGLATIGSISKYPDCPLSGEVVGTLAPLRNIKLPFFADADKIFSVLQTNLTSIVLGGTLEPGKQTYVPESAAAIGSAMRTFLLGDVPQPK